MTNFVNKGFHEYPIKIKKKMNRFEIHVFDWMRFAPPQYHNYFTFEKGESSIFSNLLVSCITFNIWWHVYMTWWHEMLQSLRHPHLVWIGSEHFSSRHNIPDIFLTYLLWSWRDIVQNPVTKHGNSEIMKQS